MSELEAFEGKVAQLVALLGQVKDENRDLRLRVTQLEAANRAADAKLAAARERLEALADRVAAASEQS
ncbi:MAG: hypothetical protein JNM90_04020 [Burkholderiales bacterium]|nr:hypothetical protein [Burkholderiales bacterium]